LIKKNVSLATVSEDQAAGVKAAGQSFAACACFNAFNSRNFCQLLLLLSLILALAGPDHSPSSLSWLYYIKYRGFVNPLSVTFVTLSKI
jgi:hypothetical protein